MSHEALEPTGRIDLEHRAYFLRGSPERSVVVAASEDGHEPGKGGIITLLVEDFRPAIAPIQDMVTIPAHRRSPSSRHWHIIEPAS